MANDLRSPTDPLANLYLWLKFFHLVGLAVFLLAHGMAAGGSLALRGPFSADSRGLLRLSQRSAIIANPGLVVVIVTGVWMGFAGNWWGQAWLWATIVVLVAVVAAMFFIARPYYLARDAADQPDAALAGRLGNTRPLAAAWIGSLGLLLLIMLMVFKPF